MSDRAYAKVQIPQKTSMGSSPKSGLLQRTCACGQHTIAGGECDACRSGQSTLLRSQRAFGPPSAPGALPGSSPAQANGPSFNAAFDGASRFGYDFSQIPIHSPTAGVVQTKLAINKPGDEYEQEADRVADQVMRTPEPELQRACDCGGTCLECKAKQAYQKHERLQMKRVQASDRGQAAAPPIVHEVLRSPGHSLDTATRAFMESRFSYDFSQVRVHTDVAAAQSTREVNATAYTVGNDIIFGSEQFAPTTQQGQRLIAHELTHVIQQGGGMTAVQRAPADDQRWSRDEAAAGYRGQLMAKRIRKHGVLSKEARAKINQELAYFEGSAKEAYLKEVRPALRAVTEIEMPVEYVVPHGPEPVSSSLLSGDPRLITNEQIYAPLTEAKHKDEEELALEREHEMEKLRQKTKGWGSDQAFALDLLRSLLQYRTNVDPRAVSDKIRQPILERYRDWLQKEDKKRHEVCLAMPSEGVVGFILKSQAKFHPSLDPCISSFKDEYSHGPSELADLERHLKLNRYNSTGESPAEHVYWDVFEYRKKTDPFMLEQEEMAGELVSGAAALTGAPGEKFNPSGTVPSAVATEEGQLAPSKSSVLPELEKSNLQPESSPTGPSTPAANVPHQQPKPSLVVSLGGEGEIPGAININRLEEGATLKPIEKIKESIQATGGVLVKADITELPIASNSVKIVIGRKLPFTKAGSYAEQVTTEAYRVLEPGETVKLNSISALGGQDWLPYLKDAGFQNVHLEASEGTVYAVGTK